jgi:hypothetical protein
LFPQIVRALIYKIRRPWSHFATESCNSRHSSGFAPYLESYFIPLRSLATDAVSAEAVRIWLSRKLWDYMTMKWRRQNIVQRSSYSIGLFRDSLSTRWSQVKILVEFC